MDNITINGSVIPEPATLGLITAAGAAMLFIRRRLVLYTKVREYNLCPSLKKGGGQTVLSKEV